MAELYNISEWSEQSWWNTGGTRDKKIYLDPKEGETYFFKQSFKKGKRDYKYEFWSEIIASEIGVLLGFNILPYHIAIREETVGCISKSMIDQDSEELIEGGKYLQAFDNTFNPDDIKLRYQYTFDLILNALTKFNQEKHLKDLIDTIVFDALIGNSDRHQDNWAIINTHTKPKENKIDIADPKLGWLKKILKLVKSSPPLDLIASQQTRFAPIYDSGCSFGRELNDERVRNMLKNGKEIQKYVKNGKAEIHWKGNKIDHFELIGKLLEREDTKNYVLNSIEKVQTKFDISIINQIIHNVDDKIRQLNNPNFLPSERKELIVELLTLRFKNIEEIYSQK